MAMWCVAKRLDFVWALLSPLAMFCWDSWSASIVLTVNFAWIPRNRRQYRPIWAAWMTATMHYAFRPRLGQCENLFLNPMACVDWCWTTTTERTNFWTWDKHWSATEDSSVYAPHCSEDEFPFCFFFFLFFTLYFFFSRLLFTLLLLLWFLWITIKTERSDLRSLLFDDQFFVFLLFFS